MTSESTDKSQTVLDSSSSLISEQQPTEFSSTIDEVACQKILSLDQSADKSSTGTTKLLDITSTQTEEKKLSPEVVDVKLTEENFEETSITASQMIPNLSESQSNIITKEINAQKVSEGISSCPVPIQVAESVLQVESKDAVSEDTKSVEVAVASSIISSVEESTKILSDVSIKSQESIAIDTIAQTQETNGNDSEKQSSIVLSADKTTIESQGLFERELPVAETNETSLQKSKLTVTLPKTETSESQLEQTSIEQQPLLEDKLLSETSSSSPSAVDTETPVRPTRSKDLKIPGTPIVIGPTPPTSPPLEADTVTTMKIETEQQLQAKTTSSDQPKSKTEDISSVVLETLECEKTEKKISEEDNIQAGSEKLVKKVKKIVKKSSAESDTPSSPESEGSVKKSIKKVIKKVSKKSKEDSKDEDEGGSGDKSKKTTKIKKLTKSSSASLESDETVPETPPPTTGSDPPVPPRRKSKSSVSSKVTDTKTDES